MTRRSLFLSFFAFAVATSSYAAGPPQKVIESFIRAATSSKPAVAYEMLTDATRLRLGEPQFTAYMHVRRELLGGLRSVGAATRAPEQDVDGVTFYARLTQQYPPLRQRVIFLTGDIWCADSAAFLAACGQPWLPKPCTITAVRHAIQQVLGVGPAQETHPVSEASHSA